MKAPMMLSHSELLHCDVRALAQCQYSDLIETRAHYANMVRIKAAIKRMSNNAGAYDVTKSAKRSQRLYEQLVIKLDKALDIKLCRALELPS